MIGSDVLVMLINAMRAIVMSEHGGPEVLRVEELPDPIAGEGEVLIRSSR